MEYIDRALCPLHLLHDRHVTSSDGKRRIDQPQTSPTVRSPSRARKSRHRQGVSFRPHLEGPQQPLMPGGMQSPPTGLGPLQSGEVFAPPHPKGTHNTRREARYQTLGHCLLSHRAVSSSCGVGYGPYMSNGGLVSSA